jgi:hypothetical protein
MIPTESELRQRPADKLENKKHRDHLLALFDCLAQCDDCIHIRNAPPTTISDFVNQFVPRNIQHHQGAGARLDI